MEHLDLFSGIGGFALACEWAGIETICFCEIDPFCQKVLRKHWSDVPIVKDVNNVEEIKRIVADAKTGGIQARAKQSSEASEVRGLDAIGRNNDNGLLFTAGFPCQPFSAAGRRKGSADDRYLWPQTLSIIEAVKPDWVLLENVAGILSMVFPDSAVGVASQASFCEVPNDEIADYDTISGRIDRDLRQAGYETVWLVVPACAVNAPHRRDRVWIIGQRISKDTNSQRGSRGSENSRQVLGCGSPEDKTERPNSEGRIVAHNQGTGQLREEQLENSSQGKRRGSPNDLESQDTILANATQPQSGKSRESPEPEGRENIGRGDSEGRDARNTKGNPGDSFREIWPGENTIARGSDRIPGWQENWYEVAQRFCRVDDGFPDRLARYGMRHEELRNKYRVEKLKASGNAIVPQVAYEIIKAITEVDSKFLAL